MKQKITAFWNSRGGFLCKLALCILLIWFLFPRNFNWLIPYRTVHYDQTFPTADQTVIASHSFSADPGPYSALLKETDGFIFLADLRTLLPFVYQPDDHVDVRIRYYCTGRGYPASGTHLLWDGNMLWVAFFGNHYFGYHPLNKEEFQAAMDDLVAEYGNYDPFL